MQPRAEMVHWFFGAGILFVGLCLLCEAIVGTEVWRIRRGLDPAVRRPRRRARLRAPLAARRGAAPMRAFLVTVAVALAFPALASAHATLRSTTPTFGTELQRGPTTIRLHFDQSVTLLPDAVRVLNGVGRNFAGLARVEGTDVVANVRPLKLGAYTVRWHAVSADSHVVSGVWTFGVRVPAPAISDAYGAGGPTTTEHLVRWLWFLGMALTIGALGLRLIVLRGLAVPRDLERKIAVAAGIGCAVTLQSGIAAFSLRAEDALQLPFGKFLYGDLSPMAA